LSEIWNAEESVTEQFEIRVDFGFSGNVALLDNNCMAWLRAKRKSAGS
jgi:hypothetical protein